MFQKLKYRYLFYYYTKIFSKLYWYFLKHGCNSDQAGDEACTAFQWLTGYGYLDLYKKIQTRLYGPAETSHKTTSQNKKEEQQE